MRIGRIRSSIGLLAWMWTAACAGQPWSEPPRALDGPWSFYSAFDTGSVTILATSFEAARNVHATTSEVLESLAARGVDAGRGIVIAVDQHDPPLLADPVLLWSRLDEWQAAATGQPSQGAAMLLAGHTGPDVLRLAVAAGLPPDGGGLDLPIEGSDWAAIVPTDAALASVAYELYRSAINRTPRISVDFERCYTKLPVTRLRLRREFAAHTRPRLCAVILAARAPGVDAAECTEPGERIDHLLARLAAARIVFRNQEYRLE